MSICDETSVCVTRSNFLGMLFLVCCAFAPHVLAQDVSSGAALQQLEKDTMQLMESIKTYSAAQRQNVVQESEMVLDKLDDRFETLQTELDAQWDSMSMTTRKQFRATMSELQQRRVEVAEWLGGVKSTSSTAWDSVTEGFSIAYEELYDAWQEAETAFTESAS